MQLSVIESINQGDLAYTGKTMVRQQTILNSAIDKNCQRICIVREYMSGNLRKKLESGLLSTNSFALLSQLENRRKLCVCFDSKVSR